MNIFIAMPQNTVTDTFLTPAVTEQLAQIGDVKRNPYDRNLTAEELIQLAEDAEILITGWGTCYLTGEAVRKLPRLRMIAHTGGSVALLADPDIYSVPGLRVISGNDVFARSVAEGCLCYTLSALRRIEHFSSDMKSGGWMSGGFVNRGLIGKKVGIVGFGAIARYFLEAIRWFGCEILICSSHLSEEDAAAYHGRKADMEEIFSSCDVVSLHMSLTPETKGSITRELLMKLKPDALLVNTARGQLVDEKALAELLGQGRFSAALDVYEKEPLAADSPLRNCENVLLMPHMGGPTVDMREVVAKELTGDIRRLCQGDALRYEITAEQAGRMSRG